MDTELAAIHQALQDLHEQGLQGEDIHGFVDSQAALKRLQKSLLQEAKGLPRDNSALQDALTAKQQDPCILGSRTPELLTIKPDVAPAY
jgi:ribonuclease HI